MGVAMGVKGGQGVGIGLFRLDISGSFKRWVWIRVCFARCAANLSIPCLFILFSLFSSFLFNIKKEKKENNKKEGGEWG